MTKKIITRMIGIFNLFKTMEGDAEKMYIKNHQVSIAR